MKILVNLYNLTSGGGLTIGYGFVEELYKLNSSDSFILVVPSKKLYPFESNEQIKLVVLPQVFLSNPGKLFAEYKISKIAAGTGVDKIISLTNYAIPTNIPQTLLIHWPYIAYPEQELWKKMSFPSWIKRKLSMRKIKSGLKYVVSVVVQTEVMKSRLSNILSDKKVHVLPAFHNFEHITPKRPPTSSVSKKLLFVSRFYEHKNHEILIPLAREMEKRNSNIRIFTTINQNHPFLKDLQKYGRFIVNLGEQSAANLAQIYPVYDGLFFPTLVETYGIPYLEAFHFGLHIYTSDRDFARVVCGDYAQYFDPTDPINMLDVLETNPSEQVAGPDPISRNSIVQSFLGLP